MSESDQHLSHFALNINGGSVPSELMDALLDCTIENSLHLPDMCALRFHDYNFQWLDNELLTEGHPVEIKGGNESDTQIPIFQGEIISLEVDMVAHGTATLLVRCYDRSHRLHRGKQSRTFSNTKDSDIVKKVGGEVGLTVHADQTNGVHDWIIQNNQTNWEFLQERAAYNGYRLFVKGDKDLYFQKVKDAGDSSLELTWGDDLRSFRPRRSAAGQVNEVEVRGWDPKIKEKIVGICKAPSGTPKVGDSKNGGAVAKKAFGSAKHIVVDRPIHTQVEAEDLARSLCDQIAGEFLQAEGLCFGRPDLKPGKTVKIQNIGKRFSGEYLLTSTQHTYTPSEGYASQFSVDGKSPATLLNMLDNSSHEHSHGTSGGHRLGGNIVVGIVTDNKDPQNEGRVKVKYPWLTEDHTSYWARQCSQMAGKGRGMYNIPEINDEVLIAFEHGDIRRPFILGQLWNGKDAMPKFSGKPMHGSSSEVNRRGFHSRIGHQMTMDDTDGKGNIRFETKNGHVIIFDDENEKVEITTKNKHNLVMDDKNKKIQMKTTSGHKVNLDDQGKKIEVHDYTGSNTFTIDSTSGAMDFKCVGNFSVDAKGKVSIKGLTGIEMETPAQVKVHGTAGVDVKADAIMNLEATGPATLKSVAIVTVQGALVKIN